MLDRPERLVSDMAKNASHATAAPSQSKPQAKPDSKPAPDPITPDSFAQIDAEKFTRNMLDVGLRSQQLIGDYIKRAAARDSSGPLDPLNVSGAFLALAKAMSTDRQTVINTQ